MSAKISFTNVLTKEQFKAVYHSALKSKFHPTLNFANGNLRSLYYSTLPKDKVDSISAWLDNNMISYQRVSK